VPVHMIGLLVRALQQGPATSIALYAQRAPIV
jgi:hypothetical protein